MTQSDPNDQPWVERHDDEPPIIPSGIAPDDQAAPDGRMVRILAHRALEAFRSGENMVVTPAEYMFLRNAETETWNMAIVSECAELGMTTPAIESVAVVVTKTGVRSDA